MAVLLTFLLLLILLYAALWGGSLILQGYFYNVPATGLIWRAAAGAAVMAVFLTIWYALDRRSPGKYDTFLNFTAYDIVELDTFDAIRVTPAGVEKVVTYTRPTRARRGSEYRTSDYKDAKGLSFNRSDTDSMVLAIRVKLPNVEEPIRLQAVDVEKKDATGKVRYVFNTPQEYREVGGNRTMMDQTVGKLIVPKGGTLFVNLLLNLLQYLLWMAVLWPILRYEFWHAFCGAIILGLATMLIGVPVLLGSNRVETTKPTPPPAQEKTETTPAAVRLIPTMGERA
ncbi:hypothetical protein [Tuwongella immobilis]|uniref:Uncharacterized protein n=1 Tax=Tuwongella immobilis TaxID=692036 RepID=A0A6C2YRY9_9BACT|nr:hypothetical protein [Tuwongella immobilis]VIP03893.1 unnamed protein product [Tuwongella immobilis]VTS05153.1 unnamed protein product [Tuwongella immobilis]